ncbi:9935_t:CDS:1 [Ambispora leptoticha]|uniref:9935_t:CDS:1 n=1 Tax=Ambispora leptoticha TaxID=144679 RepID=A0A9N8WS62_9GLOM|nr:9935_t:CDS:1 [Ambispora leptoticha]
MKTKSSVNKNKKCGSMPQVTPKFPPDITAINLIEKAITKLDSTGQLSRVPNAFIAYRMAFCKELSSMKHPVITQPKLSSMVKESWSKEPENVRKEYQRIAAEARDVYRQMCQERLPSFIESEYQAQFTCNYFQQEKSSPVFTPNVNDTTCFNNVNTQKENSMILPPVSTLETNIYQSDQSFFPDSYFNSPSIKDDNIVSQTLDHLYDPFSFPSNSDNFVTGPFSSPTQDYSNSPFSKNDNLDDSVSSSPLSSNYDSSILPQANCNFCKEKVLSLQEKIQKLEKQLEKLTNIVTESS